jgi:hypothetical protein
VIGELPHLAARMLMLFSARTELKVMLARSPANISGTLMKRLLSATILAISLSGFVAFVPTRSFADERCQQLLALRAQFAGVELTSDQKQMKVKLVSWYYTHCRRHHEARAD